MKIHQLVSNSIFVMIFLLVFLPTDIYPSQNHNLVKSNDIYRLLSSKIPSIHDFTIALLEPSNSSTITNGTKLLLRLTGSLDKKIFYRWSSEPSNSSFIVQDEYFIINTPEILDYESWISLYLYASINSSEEGSDWISYHYSYYYDFKAPSFTYSIANNSATNSFTNLTIETSEPIFASKYRWSEISPSYSNFPDNVSIVNLYIDFPKGIYTLELQFNDSISNQNRSILNYSVLFTVLSDPTNESFIQGSSILSLIFSDPYNALYAWNDTGYSGVLDLAPQNEGNHTLNVKVEKALNVWEIWNFTFTVDNTPIDIQVLPSSGYIPPFTNLSITVDDTPITIWGEISGSNSSSLTINGSDPDYWAILPATYGPINVTIYATDSAGNIATLLSQFEISLSVSWINPPNNSISDQGLLINYYLNAESWRTVLYNLDNTYNTTFSPVIPSSSGLHNLMVYLEDNKRRWTNEYFQWWVKPQINASNVYNDSYVRSDLALNFSFGESVPLVTYQWGDDTVSSLSSVLYFTTTLNDWSNKTSSDAFLNIHVKGSGDVWNNQSWFFVRDDSGIDINLYQVENNSVIHSPFQIRFSFNETPVEIRYSWNGADNVSSFHSSSLFLLSLPQIIADNPQVIDFYVRDEAQNWNSRTYAFYTGTGILSIREENLSRVQGGNAVLVNLTLNPLQIGYQWYNYSDQSVLTTIQWLSPATNYPIIIPPINGWSNLVLFYDLTNGNFINETLTYFIDIEIPVVTVLGTVEPFINVPLVYNGSLRVISSSSVINLTISEDSNVFKVLWNNNNILFEQSTLLNQSFSVDMRDLSSGLFEGNLTVFIEDLVGNSASFLWFFSFDNVPPHLLLASYADNSRLKPNISLLFTFNESVYSRDVSWFLDGFLSSNESLTINTTLVTLHAPLVDGTYSLSLTVYDMNSNKEQLSFTYIVDGSAPAITLSLVNNSIHNSHSSLQITISEPITKNSFYQWKSGTKNYFNLTTFIVELMDSEGDHTFNIYVEDILGNNGTSLYVFSIDNTPISIPSASLPSGTYGSDTKEIKFYFDELPAMVIANWNNGTNQSLTIHNIPAMRFMVETEEGSYFVMVEIPSDLFQAHKLTLFIRDQAENWISYHYSFTKVPIMEIFLFIVIIISLSLVIIVFWKRYAIIAKVSKNDVVREKKIEKNNKKIQKIKKRSRQSGKMRKKGKKW
ncbi:MAG: hypothetical protein ACXADY_08000 [Candidatus Hodarchaeales archaeon]|jgi:hypothetical protein